MYLMTPRAMRITPHVPVSLERLFFSSVEVVMYLPAPIPLPEATGKEWEEEVAVDRETWEGVLSVAR
jgi:hypothetical protein